MKLTKTQREVLVEASGRPNGRVSVHSWSQRTGAPFGGSTKSGGQRKLAAILKLVEMGLLSGLSIDHHSGHPRCDNRGWTIYSTEATATLTESGRKNS